jgi:UDP-N-acetylmuramyl pentapeptide phosphotransferase/UDP-N-acetylglucosamine-1-phosphate transferase
LIPGVTIAGAAFLVSAALVPLLVRFAVGRRMLDMPNLRSSHEVPTPRLGGLAIVCGAWIGVLAGAAVHGEASERTLWPLLVAATVVGLAGLADDLRGLHLGPRAAVQTLAAAALLLAFPPPMLAQSAGVARYALLALGVFWIVGLVNAFNFMDGIDGIVGGFALVNLAFVAVLVDGYGVFFALAGGVAGFLLWNVSPASIFLGDAGSYFVGFVLAAGALYLPVPEPGLLLGPVICAAVFAPFLLDTTYTLISRFRAGKNVLSAHREHIYQRITPTTGMHRRTSALYYGAAVVAGFAALLLARGYLVPGLLIVAVLCAGLLSLPRIFGAR